MDSLTPKPRTVVAFLRPEAQHEAYRRRCHTRRPQHPRKQLRPSNLPPTCFTSRRVNSTTFLIIEDDLFGENPHIYIKIYPEICLITDTGCNSPRLPGLSLTCLRQYIQEYPIQSNNNQPLNPQGRKGYVIIFSHCHYDHILGIEQFEGPDTTIIASNHSKSFILEDLPTHSLCNYVDVPTPIYKINHWARNLEYLNYRHKPTDTVLPLRIQTFQVPGHTPDSLAWYDLDEHHLYVGDTFYTKAPIIFPPEGNWIDYQASLFLLFDFVTRQNQILRQQHASTNGTEAPRVLVSCGHSTVAADAESMISEVQSFFMRIVGNAVPVVESVVRFGEVFDLWEDPDEDAYSVLSPRRLLEEARRRIG